MTTMHLSTPVNGTILAENGRSAEGGNGGDAAGVAADRRAAEPEPLIGIAVDFKETLSTVPVVKPSLVGNHLDDPIFDELYEFNVTTVDDFQRSRRGALQLAQIMKCATGCNPLSYKGYGCYCGFLGSGTPVDGIDK